MKPALEWHREGDRFSLKGRIDEYADLQSLAAELPDGAVLDLGGLTRINSIGVREWLDFVAALGTRTIRLERCAPVFVDQLNTIANFAGRAEITSVLCAYECERDAAFTVVEVSVEDAKAGKRPAVPRCTACGEPMIPAVEDESFYKFVRYAR